MVKTPDQLKNMVEEYIKTTGAKYEDRTIESQKIDPNIQWHFVAGVSINIQKLANRDDRINIDYAINLTPEHIEKAKQLGDEDWGSFLGALNEFILLKGLTYRYTMKDNVITGIIISGYVDVEELNRPNLFKVWDAVAGTGSYVLNKISVKLNMGITPTGVSNTSSPDMYG